MAKVKRKSVAFDFDIRTAKVLLLVAVAALVVIGLLMVYSTTSAELSSKGKNPFEDVIQQAAFAVIGIVGMVVIWQFIPFRLWTGNLLWIAYGICIALLIATIFFGTEVNGAKRWLYIGPVGMQPSELIKIALLLMTTRIMYMMQEGRLLIRAGLLQIVAFVVLPLAVMYVTQSDLGTTLICCIGVFAVLWLGGISTKWLLGIAGAVVLLAFIAIFGVGYRGSRFVYLDPWNDGSDGLGSGYNIIRAYYAISEGGLFGAGIGNSHEKYSYLFASESDFIFAIICEELGLIGALFVIALFLTVLVAGLKIARSCSDDFGKMMAGAFTIMLVFQAFLNIGCAIGVFPTTGKPLPFISAGGTSIVSSLVIIGLILSVEHDVEADQKSHEKKRQDLRVMWMDGGPRRGQRR